MNDKQNDDLDDATIIVSKQELDEATTIVSKHVIDDSTIIVSKQHIDDSTVIVSKKVVDDLTAPLDEATIVFGGLSSVEEETITNSNPMEENTISSTRTGDTFHEFTFTGTGEPAPTPTKAIPIVEAIQEPDAELKVETFVNPDVANKKLKITKVEQSEQLTIPEYDDRIIRTAPPAPKANSLNDAAKLMKKNERRAKQGMTTVIAVIVGAALIGAVIAILLNGK